VPRDPQVAARRRLPAEPVLHHRRKGAAGNRTEPTKRLGHVLLRPRCRYLPCDQEGDGCRHPLVPFLLVVRPSHVRDEKLGRFPPGHRTVNARQVKGPAPLNMRGWPGEWRQVHASHDRVRWCRARGSRASNTDAIRIIALRLTSPTRERTGENCRANHTNHTPWLV
jgi:hypothetical protein